MLKPAFVVAVALAIATAAPAQITRTVRVSTPDEVGVFGTYYPVGAASAPAVFLIHSLGQSRTNWTALATRLQASGFAVLAIDLRGHGESVRRLTADGPQLVDFHAFGPHDYQDMLLDINSAMDWLTDQRGIKTDKIAVIGAGLGANLALRYATFNEDLAALVLISPGINYRGLRTDDVINKVGNLPLRLIVSKGDDFSYESCRRLTELRKQAGHEAADQDLWVSTGHLSGTDMIDGIKALPDRLLGWLQEVLVGAPLAPPPKQ